MDAEQILLSNSLRSLLFFLLDSKLDTKAYRALNGFLE